MPSRRKSLGWIIITVLTVPFAMDQTSIFSRIAYAETAGQVDMSAAERISYYRRFLKLPSAPEDATLTTRATDEAQAQLQAVKGAGADATNGGQPSGPIFRVVSQSRITNPAMTLAISKVDGTITGGDVVDRMMTLPFTGLRVIDPQLARVGFGLQCDGSVCAAALAVRRGLDKSTRLELYEGSDADRYWNPNLGPIPPTPAKLNNPVEFPPDGGLASELASGESDWPAPLTVCPGYSAPTGPPIILQLGKGTSNDAPDVSAHILTHDGQEVKHCLIAQTSLEGENSSHSSPIWQYLNGFGAVIMIPREPLAPSSTYSVSITADSNNNSWSFRTPAK